MNGNGKESCLLFNTFRLLLMFWKVMLVIKSIDKRYISYVRTDTLVIDSFSPSMYLIWLNKWAINFTGNIEYSEFIGGGYLSLIRCGYMFLQWTIKLKATELVDSTATRTNRILRLSKQSFVWQAWTIKSCSYVSCCCCIHKLQLYWEGVVEELLIDHVIADICIQK